MEPDQLLPAHLRIDNIDSHLYQIGLQLSPIRPNIKRIFIYNPIVIAIIITIIVVQRLICLLFTDQRVLYLMGDFGAFYSIKIYINTLIGLIQLFILASQLVYFSNHKRGIEPTFLRLFQMMSGSVPPNELGLNDRKQILGLINITRKLFLLLKFNSRYVSTFISFVVVFLSYLFHTPLSIAIIYGGMSTVTLGYLGYTFWNILGYQYLYFYILCKYLNFKQYNLIEKLKLSLKGEIKKQKKKQNLPENIKSVMMIIRDLDNVYREIDEYNATYLSKFIFNLWLLLSAAFVILSYVALFVSLLLPIKIVVIYAFLFYNGIFIHTISTAASVNYQVKLTYLPLNSVFASLVRHKDGKLQNLLVLFKV